MRPTLALTLLLAIARSAPALTIGFCAVGGDIGSGDAIPTRLAETRHQARDLTAAMRAGNLPLDGLDILIIGAFVTAEPAIRAALDNHRDALLAWVAAGGVVLESCQADQHEQSLGWLPDGVLIERADPDYPTITWQRPGHPIASVPHKLDTASLTGWKYRGWSIAWETLTVWAGAEVIASCGPQDSRAALLELDHGQGRILISSICPDTMMLKGEGDSPAKARLVWDNYLAYLEACAANQGVELHPTPGLQPVLPPDMGNVQVGLVSAPDAPLIQVLAGLGVTPKVLSAGQLGLSGLGIVILDAGQAEALEAGDSTALRTFAEQGGVVIELHQNLDARPGWLPAAQAGRGGMPGDYVLPEAEGQPLFSRPNTIEAMRRGHWRDGDLAVARQPLATIVGWGVLARFGGETAPAAVVERGVGQGRVILAAADFAPLATATGLAKDNPRALLSNLMQYAADAAQGKVALASAVSLPDRELMQVGRQVDGSVFVPTEQLIRPAGRQVEFPGRPTDLLLLPDGNTLAVADRNHLRLIEVDDGELEQSVASDGGHSYCGLVATQDGRTIYTTSAKHVVQRWSIDAQGVLTRGQPLPLPGSRPVGVGLALSADEQTLYAAASRSNSVVAIPLAGGEVKELPVGMAPYMLRRVGDKLYVSNWGGRRPKDGERTAPSSGSQVLVDERTVGSSGTVSVIDLGSFEVSSEIEVGLLPSGLCVSPDGRRVFVANANSDTVSAIDTANDQVVETISVKPSAALPFGSAANALAISPDGGTLYVANGTNNAVAVVRLSQVASGAGPGRDASAVQGTIPTGWFPGALAISPDGRQLYVANTKGIGSRAKAERHNSHDHQGSVSVVDLPGAATLADWTAQTAVNNRLAAATHALEPPRPNVSPRALPERHGEPSLIKHVVYIIRENRTYDQVLGDLPQGNGDPALVHFGREVTPNGHQLAEQFVLLDNFYCSGVLSADGHQWTDEGYVTGYLEKMFGGFTRSYPYEGDDALSGSPGGYIWDNVLAHGKRFRSYGEMVQAHVTAKTPGVRANFKAIYDDFVADQKLDDFEVRATAQIAAVQANLCETTIGFPSIVPDIYRANEFIKELRQFEADGAMPEFCIMLLPNDHTAGTRPGMPTPRAAVADNDLALGQIVEAISHSKFWPTTAIFVCQDDPQAGVDHVDGHRSPAFVISPYTPRGKVDSRAYTQVGMLKTIELLLGLPPMNQLDLAAEPMSGCFQDEPDFTPYDAVPNNIPLDELNPAVTALRGEALQWALASLAEPLDEIDEADEDTLNRILWHAVKGDGVPYPSRYSLAEQFDDD